MSGVEDKNRRALKDAHEDLKTRVRSLVLEVFPDADVNRQIYLSSGTSNMFAYMLAGREGREVLDTIVEIDFPRSSQASKFLRIMQEKGFDAKARYSIKKRGLDWKRTKTFRKVTVSPKLEDIVRHGGEPVKEDD